MLTWLKLSVPKPDRTAAQTSAEKRRNAFRSEPGRAGKLFRAIVVILASLVRRRNELDFGEVSALIGRIADSRDCGLNLAELGYP